MWLIRASCTYSIYTIFSGKDTSHTSKCAKRPPKSESSRHWDGYRVRKLGSWIEASFDLNQQHMTVIWQRRCPFPHSWMASIYRPSSFHVKDRLPTSVHLEILNAIDAISEHLIGRYDVVHVRFLCLVVFNSNLLLLRTLTNCLKLLSEFRSRRLCAIDVIII